MLPPARRWCDFIFRPLLTATPAVHAGSQLRYEIYHASFREVLKAQPGHRLPPEEGSYELEALADELRQATRDAHDRIVSTYLTDFGRLQADLALLAQDREALRKQQPAPSLGTEIRYALMTASITSRAVRISPEFLDLLARNGMWSPERALDHADGQHLAGVMSRQSSSAIW